MINELLELLEAKKNLKRPKEKVQIMIGHISTIEKSPDLKMRKSGFILL